MKTNIVIARDLPEAIQGLLVIASKARQSSNAVSLRMKCSNPEIHGLLRRNTPRSDGFAVIANKVKQSRRLH